MVALVGFMFNHGHLARAVSGRVTMDVDENLPTGYQSNYPFVGRVSAYDMEVSLKEPCVLSINWSQADEKLEIVDGTNGRSIDE